MCALCDKINIIKDILKGYFGDEEIAELNQKIGLPGFDITGARLSLLIMALVELSVDEGLTNDHLHTGLEVAYQRYILKKILLQSNPEFEKLHSFEDWLKGFES